MSKAQVNASGHIITAADAPATAASGSGTTDAILSIGTIVYRKGTGNLGIPDGTEALTAAIVGIADAAYIATATGGYFVDGQQVTGLSGLTPGTEYWAKQDGTLAVYSGVSSGSYTRMMGVAESATTLRVAIGNVIQHA